MIAVDYYVSVLSPFAYLAGDRLERIAEAHGASVGYFPIDIAAVGGETGWTPPARRHPARLEYRLQELARGSRETGMRINLKPAHWPTDPLPASRAIAAAILSGESPAALIRATLRAVWAEERDIGDPGTVDSLLAECGLDPRSLDSALRDGEALYRENTRNAPGRGVFGVPFYIVESERFWGQDRLPALERHLASLG